MNQNIQQIQKENQQYLNATELAKLDKTHIQKIPFVISPEDKQTSLPPQQQSSQSTNNQTTLVNSIQLHLQQQNQKMIKRTLFKESMIKCSIDKEFAYIFEDSAFKFRNLQQQQQVETLYIEMNEHQEKISEWIDSKQKRALAYLPFKSYVKLYQILAFKMEGLCIIVTNYHHYLSQKLEKLNRRQKVPIQWACLSTSLPLEIKSKILQLYELRKLKLLLISPQLFQNQQYHCFESNLLLLNDIHLYKNNQELLQKIIKKTNPDRILGCYQHISESLAKRIDFPNLGKQYTFENQTWLKCENKNRTLVNYLNKNIFKKVLIIVNDKKNAEQLSSSLCLFQSMKTCNLHQVISKKLINSFSLPALLTRQSKNQQTVLKSLHKLQKYNIIVSQYFDCLRLMNFDVVIHYEFSSIDTMLQQFGQAINSCILLSDQDYFIQRSSINSEIIDKQQLQKWINNLLQKPKQRNKQTKTKKFYSDTLDDLMLQRFSVNKEDYLTSDLKSIKITKFCSDFEITRIQFDSLLIALEQSKYVQKIQNIDYQCRIFQTDTNAFQSLFPKTTIYKQKVNILNLSNEMATTTKYITDQMKKNKIKYTVCEEVVLIKLKQQANQQTFKEIQKKLDQKVFSKFEQIDKAYSLLEKFSFSNIELLKKHRGYDKRINKYFEQITSSKQFNNLPHTRLDNIRQQAYHQKIIENWLSQIFQNQLITLNDHQIVLFLLGTTTIKTSKYKDNPIYKSYYKFKYEQLLQLVHKITSRKKVKTN